LIWLERCEIFSGEKKVGHSGTLDPLATGLMLLALERDEVVRVFNWSWKGV